MATEDQQKQFEGKKVITISIARANMVALLIMIPIAAVLGVPYYLIWGVNVLRQLQFQSLGFLLLFIIAGIAIHEFLHGISWATFATSGFRSIHFGIKWEYLTPYCHCTDSLKVWQYIVGAMMPLIVMGLIPSIWAILNGNALVMLYGIFFSVASGGDIQSVWLLRKFKSNQLIYDHPEELGFILEDEDQ
jgi:hypothetical protein